MLFRPRTKRFGFQGAIPEIPARLAKSIGHCRRAAPLTPHDLMEEIARISSLRDTLEGQLAAGSSAMRWTKNTDPADTMLPAELVPAVETAVQDFLTRFVNDLPFRRRMVARLVLADRAQWRKSWKRWNSRSAARAAGSPPTPPSASRTHYRPRSGRGSSSRSRAWSSASACRRWWSARCWPSIPTGSKS